jgi:hypothetical protein
MSLRLTAIALFLTACNATPTVPPDLPPISVSPPRSRQPIPVRVDPRTLEQINAAACSSPAGYRCLPKPTILAASSGGTRPQAIPDSWTVPAWFIDPSNVTTCASDNNTGTSATCGGTGVGPLRTWGELNNGRWGCQGSPNICPRLRQSTTITFQSDHTDGTDPVYFFPSAENGPIAITVTGVLNASRQQATGTLGTVTAKNRATGQLLNVVLAAGLSVGQMVVNTTHPSRAWLYTLVSGTTWAMTQPLTAYAFPAIPTEVDTWTLGDAYTVYNPVKVNFAVFRPSWGDLGVSPDDTIFLQQMNLWDPGGSGVNVFQSNQYVDINEAFAQRVVAYESLGFPFNAGYIFNTFFQTGIGSGASQPVPTWFTAPSISAGAIGSPGAPTLSVPKLTGCELDLDVIFHQRFGILPAYIGQARVGQVYIDTATVLTGSGFVDALTGGPWSATSQIWGPGILNMIGAGRVAYPVGSGKAAATFLNTGGLQANGQSRGCLGVPTAGSAYASCNLALTPTQLDTSLGTTVGCIGAPNSAGYCNYGP